MVEIPEHLLKRSKERRAALGLGGGEATPESGAESAAQPAAAPAATPAPAKAAPKPEPKAPEPPKPDPVYIQAAKQRHRLPWWSIPVFAGLPIWGWIFLRTLSPAAVEADPLELGSSLYADCSGCHGTDGAGQGTFPALTTLDETFPDFRDQMMWVRLGTQAGGWPADTYGPEDREISGGMPGFSQYSDQQLAQVVLFERTVLSNLELDEGAQVMGPDGEPLTLPDGEPLLEEHLRQIAEGELTFEDVGLGIQSEELGIEEENLQGPAGTSSSSDH